MRACVWSAKYEAEFVKQGKTKAVKAKSQAPTPEELPGVALSESDPMFRHVLQLGDISGWHQKDGVVIQVARNARSFRTPRPRFLPADYPLRSSFARFDSPTGSTWRRLETEVEYDRMTNPQGMIGTFATVLISCFHAKSHKKDESAVKVADGLG